MQFRYVQQTVRVQPLGGAPPELQDIGLAWRVALLKKVWLVSLAREDDRVVWIKGEEDAVHGVGA